VAPALRERFGDPALAAVRQLVANPVPVGDMYRLRVFESAQELNGSGRVKAVAFELGDQFALAGDVLLALGDVPFCLGQVTDYSRVFHAHHLTR